MSFAKLTGSNVNTVFSFFLCAVYYPQKVAIAPFTHSGLQELLPLKWLSLLPTEVKGQAKPPLDSTRLHSVTGLLSSAKEGRTTTIRYDLAFLCGCIPFG